MNVPPSTRKQAASFRIGDIVLTIWALGEKPPFQMLSTIKKILPENVQEKAPALAHMFTPEDISVIRKLTREAEDALFNYQSVVYLHPQENRLAPRRDHKIKEES